jgi:hypothetical protein
MLIGFYTFRYINKFKNCQGQKNLKSYWSDPWIVSPHSFFSVIHNKYLYI